MIFGEEWFNKSVEKRLLTVLSIRSTMLFVIHTISYI